MGEIRVEGEASVPTPPSGHGTLFFDPVIRHYKQVDEFGIVIDIAGSTVLPSNVVVINSLADFAIQDATTITLEDSKTYIQGPSLTTSKRFIVGKNVSIFSHNPSSVSIWEYTGAGDMFNGVDSEFFNMFGFGWRCPNAQFLNFSDTILNTTIVNLELVIGYAEGPGFLIAEKFGTFTDLEALLITNSSASVNSLGVNDGVSLLGTDIDIVSIDRFALFSNSATFVGLDLNNVVVELAYEVSNFVNIGVAFGSIGFSGLINSGNINPGLLGTFDNCDFAGSITPLSGISESDIRFEFNNCSPIENSSKSADIFLTTSRTVPITIAGVYEPVAGSDWSSEVTERYEFTTSGILTYKAEVGAKTLINVSATVAKVGGGANEIAMQIAINGTPQAKTFGSSQNTAATTISIIGLFDLLEGNTIQLFVSNLDGTSDVIVSSAILSSINGF